MRLQGSRWPDWGRERGASIVQLQAKQCEGMCDEVSELGMEGIK